MTTSKQSPLRYYATPQKNLDLNLDVDICVYAGNSGGIIAAIAAKRKGLSVALLEPGYHLGGLTAGGLGLTDIGNKFAIGGLSREFYRRVGKKYGKSEAWVFEPHVAEAVYREWLEEMEIPCYFESFLSTVETANKRIVQLRTENGITVKAKQFIDASYEGDLMAKAGVSFTVGRESNDTYKETCNGRQVMNKHQFNFEVDPYIVEGDPSSGLLPGIDGEQFNEGVGDKRVQAYNFRLCLTDDPKKRIPFTEPEGYDRNDYELLVRYCKAGYVPEFNKFNYLTNGKYDMNNHGAISTDYIGMNHNFPEASYETREEIFQAHVQWVKGLMWFWLTDTVVDESFKEKYRNFGWSNEDFPQTGGFSHALYVREARRLVGDLVMNEHHCRGHEVVDDAISLAAYTMDSHNCSRVVIDGKVRNEGDVQIKSGPPYPVSYRCIIPKQDECTNLYVPFCISASHIAFGSIRMEPVFMILAESAIEAATIAIEDDLPSQEVPYTKLKARLEKAEQIIHPVPPAKNVQMGE
ncbi:FAD-dependent oxidoreductase [Coraliomargarita sp. SDUM461003]|uniref:FAD-dependent oxidoreductase n=1 Tax=Thalassobacterium maritimum TaxID=3041265 RepID=A0ABU1AQN2_9BACT|nr:FAD-dependent oxidoreductase [Coraliomargarita sp. SDUM461003]MDQ8206358.1 FAD-dependent oxidoreductase [Coraliomargarita sp. SDUM461003]